jgi:hypothetical protein
MKGRKKTLEKIYVERVENKHKKKVKNIKGRKQTLEKKTYKG